MIKHIIDLWNDSSKKLPSAERIHMCYPMVFIHILTNKCLPYEKPKIPNIDSVIITRDWCGVDICRFLFEMSDRSFLE